MTVFCEALGFVALPPFPALAFGVLHGHAVFELDTVSLAPFSCLGSFSVWIELQARFCSVRKYSDRLELEDMH
jgi:hypothetical protein